jgi:hypothetical protein
MSRIGHKIIGTLAIAFAAVALGPASSIAMYSTGAADSIDQAGQRTGTELGQAVGEPNVSGLPGTASRTTTELAQRVEPQPSPGDRAGGFDWGDAAIGAAAALGLGAIAFAGVTVLGRRRTVGDSRVPVPSS